MKSARPTPKELLERAVEGDEHAIARLLTKVETSLADAAEVMELAAELPRRGRTVGFIGPPGVGKSSLVAALIAALAERQSSVAVVANDPTGARTGGAILGDRVRMKSLSQDDRVFIRSAAARDPLRSLAATTLGAVELLARVGFDYVLIESVGTGQSDIGTRLVADTTVLVLAPGLGDDVQALKSGVMEVADLFVVSKADLPRAAETTTMLRRAVRAMPHTAEWVAPVLELSAVAGTGIAELIGKIDEHAQIRVSGGSPDARTSEVLVDLVSYEVARRLRRELPSSPALAAELARIHDGGKDVIRASVDLADSVLPPIPTRAR